MDETNAASKHSRRNFLASGMLAGVAAALPSISPPGAAETSTVPAVRQSPKPFEFDEITVARLLDGMQSGRLTARFLAEKYLTRIENIDKHGAAVNSVIEINPEATAFSDTVDFSFQEPAGELLPKLL